MDRWCHGKFRCIAGENLTSQTGSITKIDENCEYVSQGIDELASDAQKTAQRASEIEKINELVLEVIDSVKSLSVKSSAIISFLDETVLKDDDELENMAQSYQEDATYYSEISNNLGASSEELSASVQKIVSMINSITESQSELNRAMNTIEVTLHCISENTNGVVAETMEALDSSKSLSETVKMFDI